MHALRIPVLINRTMIQGNDDESLNSEGDDHSFDSSIESQKGILKSENSSINSAEEDDNVATSWGSVSLFTDSASDSGITMRNTPRYRGRQNHVRRNDNMREDCSPSCSSRVFISHKRSSVVVDSSHQDRPWKTNSPFGNNWLFSRQTTTKHYPTKDDIGVTHLKSAPQYATSATTRATKKHDIPSVVQIDTRGLQNVEELSPTFSGTLMMTPQSSTVLEEWESSKRKSPSLLRERDTNRLTNHGGMPSDVQCDYRGFPLESPLTCSGRHTTSRRNFVSFGTTFIGAHAEQSRRLSTEAIHTRSNFMSRSSSRSSSGFDECR